MIRILSWFCAMLRLIYPQRFRQDHGHSVPEKRRYGEGNQMLGLP